VIFEKSDFVARSTHCAVPVTPLCDFLLKGGTVIDGQRTPRFTGEVTIAGGRIAAIGSVPESDAARVFDARGLLVAPGFVDLYTRFDSKVFWGPYCTISGWHGMNAVVIGNCGFGCAPVKPEDRERAMLTMERNEAVRATTMAAGVRRRNYSDSRCLFLRDSF
jgi:N-acyl-D-amino-acid deacylase